MCVRVRACVYVCARACGWMEMCDVVVCESARRNRCGGRKKKKVEPYECENVRLDQEDKKVVAMGEQIRRGSKVQ